MTDLECIWRERTMHFANQKNSYSKVPELSKQYSGQLVLRP